MKFLCRFGRLDMDVVSCQKDGWGNGLSQWCIGNLAQLAIGIDCACALMDMQAGSHQEGRIKGQHADGQ